MSDSELSDAPSIDVPPDSELEAGLRSETKKAAQLGDSEKYTVKNIRLATEAALSLPANFFKEHEVWKARSKEIIQHQVEQDNIASSPEASNKKAKGPKKESAPKVTKKPVKRSSIEDKRPAKKPKVASDDEESALSSPPSDSEHESESKPKAKPKKTTNDHKANLPREDGEPKRGPKNIASSSVVENSGETSDSEMSVVLDAEPVKKAQRKSKSAEASGQKSKSTNPKPKAAADTDPDQEEIKRLQGWLIKCGIRKVWGKELKPYETSKAKIKYLKQMLTDAGMTGRFSNEKAAQIKEARELAADIEAVQEGNERWGKSGSESGDDNESKTRGGRRLVRGAKNYDFLSSDGEETD